MKKSDISSNPNKGINSKDSSNSNSSKPLNENVSKPPENSGTRYGFSTDGKTEEQVKKEAYFKEKKNKDNSRQLRLFELLKKNHNISESVEQLEDQKIKDFLSICVSYGISGTFGISKLCENKTQQFKSKLEQMLKDIEAQKYESANNANSATSPFQKKRKYTVDGKELPPKVFKPTLNYPPLLKMIADLFKDHSLRDINMLTYLSTVGSALFHLQSDYDNDVVYPNLLTMILAPAASGKGSVKKLMPIIKGVSESIDTRINYLREKKKEELASEIASEQNEDANSQNQNSEERVSPDAIKKGLTDPKTYRHRLPGNSSSAKYLDLLNANEGSGFIFESEADSIGKHLSKEWANFLSVIFRLAFHHEEINKSRKDGGSIIIEEPKFAMLITGTPDQLTSFISSTGNGLFSRILFYYFEGKREWKNITSTISNNIEKELIQLNAELLVAKLEYLYIGRNVKVKVSEELMARFNEYFRSKHDNILINYPRDASSIGFRLGLIAFKIMMIFTALRNQKRQDTIECSEVDFDNTLFIVDRLLEHSLFIYKQLGNKAKEFSTKKDYRDWFAELPNEFTTEQAIELGAKYGISKRTIQRLLSKQEGNEFEKVRQGLYRKIIQNSNTGRP